MPNEEKKSSSMSPLALIAGALVIVAIVTILFLQRKESQEDATTTESTAVAPAPTQTKTTPAPQQETSQNFPMPPFHQSAEGVTLPPTKDPSTVAPAAQAAYLVA